MFVVLPSAASVLQHLPRSTAEHEREAFRTFKAIPWLCKKRSLQHCQPWTFRTGPLLFQANGTTTMASRKTASRNKVNIEANVHLQADSRQRPPSTIQSKLEHRDFPNAHGISDTDFEDAVLKRHGREAVDLLPMTIDPRMLESGLAHGSPPVEAPMLGDYDGIYEPNAFHLDQDVAQDICGSYSSQQMSPRMPSPTTDFDVFEYIHEQPSQTPQPGTPGRASLLAASRGRAESAQRLTEPISRRRHIKAQRTREPQTQEELDLEANGRTPATAQFQAYFSNEVDAAEKFQRSMELYRKLPEQCTFPADDRTFPQTDEAKKELVKKIFDAINDWSSYREWPQVVSVEARDRFIDEWLVKNASPPKSSAHTVIPADELRPDPEELARMVPSLKKQQTIVISRELNDQMVEWISWDLLKAAMAAQQGLTQIPQWCIADGA
ncbi:hypothetical protein HJFPF1_05517 [Paramyrothecium foliicola]|nr:hypothetical protein HJFPF1_05517 [Paramyrothecium foliicola]